MSNYFVLILTPFEQASSTKPKTTGIKAVTEDDSKYPQKPIIIRAKEFSRFALYAFIYNYLDFKFKKIILFIYRKI